MNEDKKNARKIAAERIREAGEEYLRVCGAELTRLFLELPEYRAAKTVMCYCGAFPEPDTSEIMRGVLCDGKILALPLVTGKGIMEARRVKTLDDLRPGAYGINEPPAYAERIAPENIDVILVPALAFDKNGFRLGHGGGYYDRYLAETNAFTVGILCEKLLWEKVPTDEHDIAVKYLITEKRSWSPIEGSTSGDLRKR